MPDEKPFMPVEELARETAPDPDYADGDNPGWFSTQWNPDSRELLLRYEPDDGPDTSYRLTEAVFRLGAQARIGGPSLGEVAYGGYLAACGGKSLVSDQPLPSWEGVTEEIAAAWTAAAEAVRMAL